MAADAQLRFEVELDLKQIEKSVQQAAELVRDGLTQALSGIESSFSRSLGVVALGLQALGQQSAQSAEMLRNELTKALSEIQQESEAPLSDTKDGVEGIGQQSEQTTVQVQGLGKELQKLKGMLAGAFAVKKLLDFGASCIELGSDLAEVQNVVDVTFTHMSKQVDQFAQNAATQFGLSETMAKQFTGTFGAMAKAFGFNKKSAYEMSTTLTGLAGDVASFYNISQNEAYTKLKSVFTGETESLKDLGIVMTQTALDSYALANGFGKTTAKMSEMEKVALRYQFVQSQLTTAAGDFSRTSDGWANQVRILQLQFDSLKATIGQGLIAALSPVIHVINTVIGKILSLANAIKSLSSLISKGKGASSSASSGLESVAKSADKAGSSASGAGNSAKKAAKDMKSVTSSLDELHIIDQSSSGSGGSGSGGDGGGGGYEADDFDMGSLDDGTSEIDSRLQAIADKITELKESFAQGFWEGLGDTSVFDDIQNHIAGIKKSLGEIFTDSEVIQAADRFGNTFMRSLGEVAGSVASIGLTIADNLLGGMDLYLQQNTGRIKKYLVDMFNIGSDISTIIGNFSVAVAEIFSVFRSDSAKQVTADLIGIFSSSFQGVTELGAKFIRDLLNIITKPITDNADQIKARIQGLLDQLKPKFDELKEKIDKLWDGLNTAYDTYAKPVLDEFAQKLSDAVDWITETQGRFDGAIGVIAGFFAAWEVIKIGEFLVNAGGVAGILKAMTGGFVANTTAILQHVGAMILDKAQTVAIVAMYAKDFVVNLAKGTAALVTQGAQFIHNTALKIADTVAQVAMTAATVAWNAVCAIATTVTTALGAAIAFLTSPIGVVVIAIVGLIAAGVLLYQHWDTVKEYAEKAWNAIKETISKAIEAVKKFVSEKVEAIRATWESVWGSIKDFAESVWNTIKEAISTAIETVKQTILSILIKIHDEWAYQWNRISEFASNLWNTIKQYATEKFEAIRDKLSEVWTSVKTTIEEKWNAIKTWVGEKWDAIKTLATEKFEAIRDKLSEIWDAVKTTIEEKWNAIKEWFSEIWQKIKDVFKPDEMLKVGKDIMNKLWNGMKEIWENITGWLDGIADTISNTFNSVIDKAKNTFKKSKEEAEADDDEGVHSTGTVTSGSSSSSGGPGVKGHAVGGFPASGEMFVARENGTSEMIGRWGGRAAVANNQQITQGITQAVQTGMRSCMAPLVATMSTIAQNATPQLATMGSPASAYRQEDDRLQGMLDRVLMASGSASGDQLAIVIELLRKIIELLENFDLVVNIDTRELRKKLKDLEKRSGIQFD